MLIEITKTMAYPKETARPLLKGNRQANTRASRRAAAVEAARKLSAPEPTTTRAKVGAGADAVVRRRTSAARRRAN
jgi:hypothetical protein